MSEETTTIETNTGDIPGFLEQVREAHELSSDYQDLIFQGIEPINDDLRKSLHRAEYDHVINHNSLLLPFEKKKIKEILQRKSIKIKKGKKRFRYP